MASTTNSMHDSYVAQGPRLTDYQERVPDDARLVRAHATLLHTSLVTANDWLWGLTKRNLIRIDARRVLAAEAEEREQHRAQHPRMLDRARGIW